MKPVATAICQFALFPAVLLTIPSVTRGQFNVVPSPLPDASRDGITLADALYIDRMDPVVGYKTESMFGTYNIPPSRILATRGRYGRKEEGGAKDYSESALKIFCQLEPSPEDPKKNPGWAVYYTMLKKGDDYFDASGFNYLTFWIRGENGSENIQIGLLDKQRQESGQQAETGPIDAYTQNGKIDTTWQEVRIPLDIFKVNRSELYQVLIVFDNKLYDTIEPRTLTVYLDDLAFE